MTVIYLTKDGVGRIALPETLAQVLVTPAVFLEPENSYSEEPFIPVEISPAIYRDETSTEQVQRMIDAGHLPHLPWDNWMTVPDDHEACMVEVDLISVTDWTKAASIVIAPKIITSANVNAERDRRIAEGFMFGGKLYDFDMKAKTNISGAAQMAFMSIVAGAPAGFLQWHGGKSPFAWVSKDNSLVQMDAITVVEFGKAAAAWEQSHIFAARMLKDMPTIPLDYADNSYWPSFFEK